MFFKQGTAAAESARHLADSLGRRRSLSTSPAPVTDVTKQPVGSPRTGSRSTAFHTSTNGVPMQMSGSTGASRRTGTGYQLDRYHTLATYSPASRQYPTLSIVSPADVAATSTSNATGNASFLASHLPTQHFDYSNSSNLAAAMVGGSPKRYPTCVNPTARGRHHRQHRGRVKITETVSDLNLARHLVNGSHSVEQNYATVDRVTANKRHLLANYGGVTTTTMAAEEKGSLGKSLQAIPDTVV